MVADGAPSLGLAFVAPLAGGFPSILFVVDHLTLRLARPVRGRRLHVLREQRVPGRTAVQLDADATLTFDAALAKRSTSTSATRAPGWRSPARVRRPRHRAQLRVDRHRRAVWVARSAVTAGR